MGGVAWSVHKELQDKSEQQGKQIIDLEKKNKELESKHQEKLMEIQAQQEQKLKEEREFQNKKIAAYEDMTNSIKNEERIELEKVEKELNELSRTWCVEEIREIELENLLKNCFDSLVKSEDLRTVIRENVKKLIKILINEKEIRHLNLEIIGKTGVGKSTLLNAILGDNLAQEKKGEPCTMETKCYESKRYDFIRIYDTRGIEISSNFDIDKVFTETLREIQDKCKKNEPEELIHCLLYCFTGTRFEREEAEILVKLRKTYEGKRLPSILVLTQDLGEEDEEGNKQLIDSINSVVEDKCDERLSEKPQHISLVKILA